VKHKYHKLGVRARTNRQEYDDREQQLKIGLEESFAAELSKGKLA
jgi:hypothetical protein